MYCIFLIFSRAGVEGQNFLSPGPVPILGGPVCKKMRRVSVKYWASNILECELEGVLVVLFHWSLIFSFPCGTAWWIVFGSNGRFLHNRVATHQTLSCYWVFDPWKWSFLRNSPTVTVFLWWGNCEHKYCALLDEKIDGYWRKFGPKHQEAIWKASQCDSDL